MSFIDADDPPIVAPIIAPKRDSSTGAAAKEVNETTPELKDELLKSILPPQAVANASAIRENARNTRIERRKMVVP
jgi:hypothetical protein